MPAEALGARVSRIAEGEKISEPNTDTGLPWTMLLRTADGRTEVIDSRARYDTLTKRGVGVADATTVFPQHEGAAVFTRPDPNRAALALSMQQQGIRTIAETDDLYLTPAHNNLFLRENGADETTRDAHARSMAAVNVNVFSTRWLRDRYAKEYRQRFGKKATRHIEMHVCRNHVPRAAWPERVERDGPLRVGFMGSPSHIWDVDLAHAAFETAKHYGCETWMVGYSPGHIEPDPRYPDQMELDDGTIVYARSQKSRDAEADWRRVIDRHVKWVAPTEFHRAALPFDIGIAPLLHNTFTSGKSDVKAIEYTISGAAVVCANLPAYNLAGWEHGVNCLMATTPVDYARAVETLANEPKLRYELVTAAQEMVRETRNEDVMKAEWSDALGV